MRFVFMCVLVCECLLLFNMCVCFVRDALCDVVCLFFCVLSVFVFFVLNAFVRFACGV